MSQKTTLVETKFLPVLKKYKKMNSVYIFENLLEIETSFQYKPQKPRLNVLKALFLS